MNLLDGSIHLEVTAKTGLPVALRDLLDFELVGWDLDHAGGVVGVPNLDWLAWLPALRHQEC